MRRKQAPELNQPRSLVIIRLFEQSKLRTTKRRGRDIMLGESLVYRQPCWRKLSSRSERPMGLIGILCNMRWVMVMLWNTVLDWIFLLHVVLLWNYQFLRRSIRLMVAIVWKVYFPTEKICKVLAIRVSNILVHRGTFTDYRRSSINLSSFMCVEIGIAEDLPEATKLSWMLVNNEPASAFRTNKDTIICQLFAS